MTPELPMVNVVNSPGPYPSWEKATKLFSEAYCVTPEKVGVILIAAAGGTFTVIGAVTTEFVSVPAVSNVNVPLPPVTPVPEAAQSHSLLLTESWVNVSVT